MLNTMWSVAVSEEVSVKQEPSDQAQFTDLQTLVPVTTMPPLPSFQSESSCYPTITISELNSPDSSSCFITSSLSNINNSLEQAR